MKPYALTIARNVSHLDLDLGFDDPVDVFDVSDPAHSEFCEILNRGNQLAFGGEKLMGMPLWVMLDCAIVPGAMLGFMAKRDELEGSVLEKLNISPEYDGWIPISEYSACASVEPGTGSGFSLQTQVEQSGIGTRTKALALAALKFRRQLGVTQFDNRAIRVHSRFGRLEILVHRPVVHTHAQISFVYAVDLPEKSVLVDMAHGRFQNATEREPEWMFNPESESDHQTLHAHLISGGRAWIEQPGWITTDGKTALPISLE